MQYLLFDLAACLRHTGISNPNILAMHIYFEPHLELKYRVKGTRFYVQLAFAGTLSFDNLALENEATGNRDDGHSNKVKLEELLCLNTELRNLPIYWPMVIPTSVLNAASSFLTRSRSARISGEPSDRTENGKVGMDADTFSPCSLRTRTTESCTETGRDTLGKSHPVAIFPGHVARGQTQL